ncbi:Putative alpha/beta hydrolase-3 [Septoria linicola]|uniref:Alpha/beta hydrolase-3 n=1 Tax=Septoria linicola TaxID=215465 RepID=A0A9Q9EF59_9PEZI|nr:Putative alpha/beta hydrolase-3 [Septoria linicola]
MTDINPTKTIVYKTVGKLDISLDIYLPSKTAQKVPILLWYHGGGLLQGHRNSLTPWMRKAVAQHNIAVISADYRFAPQVGVADILEDVQDSIRFIRTNLASHLDDPASIDPSSLAVSGSSAGGYLALLAGLYIDPKPNVILPIYPITDPLGEFFRDPQPPAMGRPLVSTHVVAEFLDPKAEPVANNAGNSARQNMYIRMQADASLAKLWKVPEDAAAAKKWRLAKNVFDDRLPPAYFLHGDADTAVGVEQADEVVGAMLGCGIEVQYERVHQKDHFLDAGPDYDNEVFWAFMLRHLK